ncbi:MAG: hypothetical protein LLF28_04875 [Nitrospiraceae bacterium]|nr:hypothetical protein [Nitrospiraceae bacterium]
MEKSLAYCFTVLLLFSFSTLAYSGDLSSILINTNKSYPGIEKENVSYLMSMPSHKVVKFIRETYREMNCKEFKNVPSQYAIAYLGMFGNFEDNLIIKSVLDCDNLHAAELEPCEYYCAYDFALNLLDIRFYKKGTPQLKIDEWPVFTNKNTSSLKVNSIENKLAKLKEKELLQSLSNIKKRPKLPLGVIEGMEDGQIKLFYQYSVYYELAKRAKKESTRNELFKEMLYLYFKDASGDGGVKVLERIIYLIEARRKGNR